MIRFLKDKESLHVLSENYIGNLSYIYRDRPFIVPITYYFDEPTNTIIGYSGEGHKIMAMRKNVNVCLGISEVESVNSWKSVLAQGVYSEISGTEAKVKLHLFSLGIKDLVIKKEHKKLDFISEFSSKIYKDDLPVVFVIKIEEITGKLREL